MKWREETNMGVRGSMPEGLPLTLALINIAQCIGFAWQGFGSEGTTGVSSVRSCQKLPLCPTKPMPASSKTDLPLAKAEPISDGGSASGITYLRKGKKLLHSSSCSRREE